jgi:surfeit locus 1 family protein
MFARGLAIALHHVEQRRAEAAQNGHKGNRYKVCHELDYRMSWDTAFNNSPKRGQSLRFMGILLAALLAVALTSSLGFWQLRRAAEKEARQAQMAQRADMSLLDGASLGQPGDSAANRADLIHRSVQLQGEWLADQTLFLDNRQMNARVGFYVVTPLRLKVSNAVILVQRGWAPRHFMERQELPEVTTPKGEVTLTGRIALAPSKLYELGDSGNGPIRQNLDLAAMRAQTGWPLLDVTVVEMGAASQGLLREWPQPATGVEKHHGYAFQWFGLSALITLLYVWFQIVRRK